MVIIDSRLQAASRVPIITFSMSNPEAAVHTNDDRIKLGLFETSIEMSTPDGEVKVLSALIGLPNVSNMLAAAAVGVALGATPMQIASSLEMCEPVPGRYEMIDEGQPYGVIVDYAHTPDALERLLKSVREMGPKRIILVFGCGGERDRGKRPIMGRIADDLAGACRRCRTYIHMRASPSIPSPYRRFFHVCTAPSV